MLVVFPYSAKDQDQAVRLAEWIRELGPNKSHRVLIVRDRRCDLEHDKAILAALGQTFAAVETMTVNDDAYDSWPESANTMFRNAAKHIEFTKKEPFLWLEPDVAPLKEGWLDAIAAAYVEAVAAGKHFMGDRVEVENVPLHMSGIAVYPGIMSNFAGLAYLAQDIAWDCAAAAQIVPQAHFTNLILHAWKHPSFTSWEMVEREILAFKPEAVLFHADKSSGLIDRLRERRNLSESPALQGDHRPEKPLCLKVGESPDAGTGTDACLTDVASGSSAPPAQFICDIFIKTYPPDYPWLKYCVRSIDKFCSRFREVIIIAPDDKCPVPNYPHRLIVEPEAEGIDGYLWQGALKATAHHYTDAPYILHVDSDCIFTKQVTPEAFFVDGKPFWLYSPYSKVEVPWQPITEKFIRHPVENEYMRRMPCLIPRFVHEELEAFCLALHNKKVHDYVMQQPHRAWSEFNALGAIAWDKFRDHFTWINCHGTA